MQPANIDTIRERVVAPTELAANHSNSAGSRGTEPEVEGRGYNEAPMAENPVVCVYQFKVVLRGVSPMIWLRILLRSDQTIADPQVSGLPA